MAASIQKCRNKIAKSFLSYKIPKSQFKIHNSTSSVKQTNSVDYCLNLVRKGDHENYMSTLLYPSTYRTSAIAVRALNVELAQVQDVTSDKMRAIMRMQFWKDAIDHIFKGSPPNTPVAKEVAKVSPDPKAVMKHKLSKVWISRILQARADHIETDSFRTVEEIETYAENTVASLNYTLLKCAGVQNSTADHAASHLGRCHGLVTMLRATPFHASRSKIYLPVELLLKHNVSEEDIRRGRTEQKVKDVIYDLACVAHQHLETVDIEIYEDNLSQSGDRILCSHITKARSFKKDVPKAALPIFNNSVISETYLKKLQLADFNIFHPSLQARNNLLPLQLLKQKLKRTY